MANRRGRLAADDGGRLAFTSAGYVPEGLCPMRCLSNNTVVFQQTLHCWLKATLLLDRLAQLDLIEIEAVARVLPQ